MPILLSSSRGIMYVHNRWQPRAGPRNRTRTPKNILPACSWAINMPMTVKCSSSDWNVSTLIKAERGDLITLTVGSPGPVLAAAIHPRHHRRHCFLNPAPAVVGWGCSSPCCQSQKFTLNAWDTLWSWPCCSSVCLYDTQLGSFLSRWPSSSSGFISRWDENQIQLLFAWRSPRIHLIIPLGCVNVLKSSLITGPRSIISLHTCDDW